MGKETLNIMALYHHSKKQLNKLYEDRMVLERVDFVHAKNYTQALGNDNVQCDKKTCVSDNLLTLVEKKKNVEFEISVLKCAIMMVDNAVKVLEENVKYPNEYKAFYTRHIKRKSMRATAVECGYSLGWTWNAVVKMEEEFESIYKTIPMPVKR